MTERRGRSRWPAKRISGSSEKIMDELLKYAVENGIIDLTRLQNEIKMNKRIPLVNIYFRSGQFNFLSGHPFKFFRPSHFLLPPACLVYLFVMSVSYRVHDNKSIGNFTKNLAHDLYIMYLAHDCNFMIQCEQWKRRLL